MALVRLALSAFVAVILILAADINPASATQKKKGYSSGPSQGFTISDGPTRRSGSGYSGRGRSGHPGGYVQGAGILGALVDSHLTRDDELDAEDMAATDRAMGKKPKPFKPRDRTVEDAWVEGTRDGYVIMPLIGRY
jgi:hypothetical protein